jgi:hypothetical protein
MITHVPYEPPEWVTRVFDRLFPRRAKTVQAPCAYTCAHPVNLRSHFATSRSKTRRRHVPITRLQAERDLVTRLAFGETVAQQDDLVARWHVDKSTVSKWLKRWEGEGLIPARTQSGRCKSLAKA